MKCVGCKKEVKYITKDGLQKFDTEKECMTYNGKPRVYIITVDTNALHRRCTNISRVFVDYREAKGYLNWLNRTNTCTSVGYSLQTKLVMTSQIGESIQERITNTKTKKSWWADIWEILS